MQEHMRKPPFLVAAGLIVAVGAWFGWDLFGGERIEAARVRRGAIREFIDERGKTRLPRTYLITMPYEARILPIELNEGDRVAKGEVLAQIVPDDLRTQVAEATAAVEQLDASIRENADTSIEETTYDQSLKFLQSMDRTVEAAREQVKASEAKLGFAVKNLERIRSLYERKAATEEEFQQAEVDDVEANVDYHQDQLILRALESIRAATALFPTVIQQYIARKALSGAVLEKQRAEAGARLEQVTRDAARGTMTSPVDGVVLERHVTNERLVASGDVLLEIGQIENLEIEAEILSQDAVQIAPGDPVEMYGPAIGAVAARGTVERIYPAGFTKISSLGVEQQRVIVVIAFDPADLSRLRAERGLGVGYRVRVRVYTAEASGTLIIPRSALFRGVGGEWQTFVVRGGRARLQAIQVGLMNDDLVEVTGGLSEREVVVVAPETNLVDGTRVEPDIRAEQVARQGKPPKNELQ